MLSVSSPDCDDIACATSTRMGYNTLSKTCWKLLPLTSSGKRLASAIGSQLGRIEKIAFSQVMELASGLTGIFSYLRVNACPAFLAAVARRTRRFNIASIILNRHKN